MVLWACRLGNAPRGRRRSRPDHVAQGKRVMIKRAIHRCWLSAALGAGILAGDGYGQAPVVAAPAPPMTLWRFLGIPQGFNKIADARINRNGNRPGLERKPPLKAIADPANLASDNPAIKAAAKIKEQEDMAKQKIKAIKYLAKVGCGCYDKAFDVKGALIEALDDCTELVRYEAAKAIGEAAANHCEACNKQCCCDEELSTKLAKVAFEKDDQCCWLEPSERVRAAAKEALYVCCPNRGAPPEPIPVPVIEGTREGGGEQQREGGTGEREGGGLPTPPPETPETTPLPPPPSAAAPSTTRSANFLSPKADRAVRRTARRQAPSPLATALRRPLAPPAAAATAEVQVSDATPLTKRAGEVAMSSPAVASASDAGMPAAKSSRRHAATLGHAPAPVEQAEASLEMGTATAADTGSELGTTLKIRETGRASVAILASDEQVVESSKRDAAAIEQPSSVISVKKAAPATGTKTGSGRLFAPPSLPSSASAAAMETGRVVEVDFQAQVVRFQVSATTPVAKGTLVKVYHKFMLGEECVGVLEVVSSKQGVSVARPVGNVSLNKISRMDTVMFPGTGTVGASAARPLSNTVSIRE